MSIRSLQLGAIALSIAVLSAACGDSKTEPASPAPGASPPSAAPAAPAPSAEPQNTQPAVPAPAPAAPAPAAPTPAAAGPGDAERGKALYTQYCASCHGATGNADGPLGQALNPRPAKHSDAAYMKSLSDEHLFTVIQKGGAAVGKSPLMAPWGGTLNEAQIRDVVAFVRTLAH
jgi:mono/diheme cytochrome c family protein